LSRTHCRNKSVLKPNNPAWKSRRLKASRPARCRRISRVPVIIRRRLQSRRCERKVPRTAPHFATFFAVALRDSKMAVAKDDETRVLPPTAMLSFRMACPASCRRRGASLRFGEGAPAKADRRRVPGVTIRGGRLAESYNAIPDSEYFPSCFRSLEMVVESRDTCAGDHEELGSLLPWVKGHSARKPPEARSQRVAAHVEQVNREVFHCRAMVTEHVALGVGRTARISSLW